MIVLPPYCKDYLTYDQLPESDRWIFNKLEICKRFGYNNYGPCGTPMPKGEYCIRPIINLNGMAAGGFWRHTVKKDGECFLKPGYVWTKWERGARSWVEYVNDNISSAQIRVEWDEKTKLEKFAEQPWSQAQSLPDQLRNISRYLMVERLGDVIIDISPRHLGEEPKSSVINDYKNYEPSYVPPCEGAVGTMPLYMKQRTNEDGSYSWEETDVFINRKIYT